MGGKGSRHIFPLAALQSAVQGSVDASTHSPMKSRVLFICTGNVCRSPMAEGLLRDLAEKAGADVEVASAGIGAMDGMPPSPEFGHRDERGGDRHFRSGKSDAHAGKWWRTTPIFSAWGRDTLKRSVPIFPESLEKTFILREFVAEEGLDLEVSDPIGGDLEEYQLTRNLIKEAIPSILRFVTTGDPSAQDGE